MTKKQAIELREDINECLKKGIWMMEITGQQKRFLEENEGFDFTLAFGNTDEKDAFNLYIL